MRASTIFALIAAVLLGLGAAVGIKYSGILDRKAETAKAPPPTLVLVAASNLYEGTFLQTTDVKVRAARSEDEKLAYRSGELLPAVTQAAKGRTTKRPIEADRVIRKDDLDELGRPQGLGELIGPCERGVHCCLHKQYCAGGLIQAGDYVDVHFTTTVEGADPAGQVTLTAGNSASAPAGRTASAVVARGVRVVARRNSLVPVNTPIGPDCCINYTLSTNPYRAALIDYVKTMGILSLHPVGSTERARYEGDLMRRRDEANALRLRNDGSTRAVNTDRTGEPVLLTYCQTGDEKEDARIAGILNLTYTISEKDLVDLFGIQYSPPQQPQQRAVEKISGVTPVGYHMLGANRGFVPYSNEDTQLASGGAARGGVILTGNERVAVDPATGKHYAGLRFRAPDALCPDRPVTAAPVIRRRN